MLRTYRCLAQTLHFCDRCFHDIEPGQMYECSVTVIARGKILVLKNHVEPPCEYPDPPQDDEMDEEGWDDIGLPFAA